MKDSQSIKIISDKQIITDEDNLVDLFNDYFSSITAELGIINNFTYLLDSNLIEDTFYQAIHKYKYHPSVVILEDKVIIHERFDFETVNEDILNIEISNLVSTFYSDIITNIFNEMIIDCSFPDNLKKET